MAKHKKESQSDSSKLRESLKKFNSSSTNQDTQNVFNHEKHNYSISHYDKNYMDERVDKLVSDLTNDIYDDHSLRDEYRRKLIKSTWYFFVWMSIFIYIIVISPWYSDYLKYLLVTGVFVSFISLMTVIYKYVFNPPKYYYKLIRKLLSWNLDKHKDD